MQERIVQVNESITATGLHQEINAGTTVRQSIVRSSVLPTIDGGTKVLKTIFAGVRTSNAITADGAGAGLGIGAGLSSTTVHDTIDLGTTVHKTIDLGTTNLGTVDLGTKHLGTVDLGTSRNS